MSVWEAGDNSKILLSLPDSPLHGHWDGLLSHVVCTQEKRGGKNAAFDQASSISQQ